MSKDIVQHGDLYVRTISFLASISFMVAGCVGSGQSFSYATQARGHAQCSGLYGQDDLRILADKMPLLPGIAPSRTMLTIPDAPSEDEIEALRLLETAVRDCKALRAAAGTPTTASEDILEARVSKLRYALYNGAIPYGVYNYGLVQALKKHTRFMVSVEQPRASARAADGMSLMGQQLSTALEGLGGRGWSCGTGGCY